MHLSQGLKANTISLMKPGHRFGALIIRKGHNQTTLANAIGVTNQIVSNFVQGITGRMQQKAWQAVAKEFGMSVADLNGEVFGAQRADGAEARVGEPESERPFVSRIERAAKARDMSPEEFVEKLLDLLKRTGNRLD